MKKTITLKATFETDEAKAHLLKIVNNAQNTSMSNHQCGMHDDLFVEEFKIES